MDLFRLKQLSSTRSFARGEAYYNEGRVKDVSEHEGRLEAIVAGQHDYHMHPFEIPIWKLNTEFKAWRPRWWDSNPHDLTVN